MPSVKTVVVVGAGIAGYTAALALRKAGIGASVYEAYANAADGIGGLLALAPNGQSALRIVDVEPNELGQPVDRFVSCRHDGAIVHEFAGIAGLPPTRLVRRAELYAKLRDLARSRDIPIEHGKRLVSVDESGDGGVVTARFADGTSARGDVLVGADGIDSVVRRLIDPASPDAKYAGYLAFNGFTDLVVPSRPNALNFVSGKRAVHGFWAEATGGSGWFANLPWETPLTLGEARKQSSSEWLRILRDVYGDDVPGGDLVRATTPERLLVYGAIKLTPPLATWHRGRMVLAGDSAHAPSSSTGQGASLAAESGVELARCLRDMDDVETAFTAYEGSRRPRCAKIADMAAKLNKRRALGARAAPSGEPPTDDSAQEHETFSFQHGYTIDWSATA